MEGYLPRPCIVGDYNLGNVCGYDLNTDLTTINVSAFADANIYASVLPGLPPKGNCTDQGCPGLSCQAYSSACYNE